MGLYQLVGREESFRAGCECGSDMRGRIRGDNNRHWIKAGVKSSEVADEFRGFPVFGKIGIGSCVKLFVSSKGGKCD